jgi:osmoprotectant transport system substrate-binding protein
MILVLIIMMISVTGCQKTKTSNDGGDKQSEETKIVNAGDPIVVRTMVDTEGQILGEVIVQMLEANGFEVENYSGTISGTKLGRTALIEKQTDLYIDYTANVMDLIPGVDLKLFHEVQSGFETAKEWDKQNGLIWLQCAPFNNTDAIAVSGKFSKENGITTMQQLADYINAGKEFKLAGSESWTQYDTGLPGMMKGYGFTLKKDQLVVGIDQGQRIQMVAEGTDGLKAAHVYGTNGLLGELGLVILEDPKSIAPAYAPAPIIVKERLEKYPEIAKILEPVFAQITGEEMIAMNAKVDVHGEPGADVAREYLLKKGLVK